MANLYTTLTTPYRDLNAARSAYADGQDTAASKAAHSMSLAVAGEEHEESGGRLKAIIFGGLDGILTSFAIIAGAHGANLGPVPMLALGISNVLADALSMGAGEFLSSRSYNSYVLKEREREMWELKNHPEGEIAEMVQLFVARGMSRVDAEVVIERMAKYEEFFVDIMMKEELSLPVPSEEDTLESLKDGIAMFLAFALFGMLPLACYILAGMLAPSLDVTSLFSVACVATVISLFALGAFKARFHDKRYLYAGVETVLLGGACAAVSYFVGRAVSQFAGFEQLEFVIQYEQQPAVL